MKTSFGRTAKGLRLVVPAIAVMALSGFAPKSAEAAGFDIFLIAEQTPFTSPTSAPLAIKTTSVYQLGDLNTSNKATSVALVSDFTFGADTALSFSSQRDPSSGASSAAPDAIWLTDQDEVGAGTSSYVNSQISTWDNVEIAGTMVDPDEQIDFGRNSSVTFNSVVGGFTDLIISDLGGIDPFTFSLCGEADCGTFKQIFNGFTKNVRNSLLGTGLFALDDSGAANTQDQTWLFRFDAPITDFVRITESGQRKVFEGARLQADFIGAQSANVVQPSPVPVPGSLPLMAGGMALLGWSMRRKKR